MDGGLWIWPGGRGRARRLLDDPLGRLVSGGGRRDDAGHLGVRRDRDSPSAPGCVASLVHEVLRAYPVELHGTVCTIHRPSAVRCRVRNPPGGALWRPHREHGRVPPDLRGQRRENRSCPLLSGGRSLRRRGLRRALRCLLRHCPRDLSEDSLGQPSGLCLGVHEPFLRGCRKRLWRRRARRAHDRRHTELPHSTLARSPRGPRTVRRARRGWRLLGSISRSTSPRRVGRMNVRTKSPVDACTRAPCDVTASRRSYRSTPSADSSFCPTAGVLEPTGPWLRSRKMGNFSR